MAPEAYAVIGFPLGHTVSPAMQQAAFDHLGIDASYKALETRPEDLEQRVKDVRRGSLAGLNVTIPHKTRAVEYLDATAPTATRTGAVNTIFWRDGALTGENTDVPAIAGVLDRAGVSRSARALLIGGGGAARAALLALLERGHEVLMANRTPERARGAADRIAPGGSVPVIALDDPALARRARECGLIVNATSLGMEGGPAPEASPLPEGALGREQFVFDMVYRPERTPLIERAQAAGCIWVGGLDMLVAQGALSFRLWTGVEAPLEVMAAAARRALQGAGSHHGSG